MARVEGFEPPTAWFVARYSIQLSYASVFEFVLHLNIYDANTVCSHNC